MNYLARKRRTCLSQTTIFKKSHSACSGAPCPIWTEITLGVSSTPVKDEGRLARNLLMDRPHIGGHEPCAPEGSGCQPNSSSVRRAASSSAFFARMKPSKSSRWERMTSS